MMPFMPLEDTMRLVVMTRIVLTTLLNMPMAVV